MEGLLSVCAERLEQLERFRKQEEITRLAAIGEMAAGLAHEIRNPLGAIRGAAQVLDPSSHRPESRFLKVIIEESDRLNRVVSEFLDYSKPSPTGFFKTFDLVSLIQKAVTMLSTTAPEGVDLQFQATLLSAPVLGSPEQIHQVLMNLIQNAFKAIVRGGKPGGRVVVSLESLDTRDLNDVYRITIEDNGPGISKDVMSKIFIPFFTTDPSGSGLGLSICQKIVRAHGGEMEVSSKPGVLTQFRVILPCPVNTRAKKVFE
jgi:signal transduction histidine kinase